MGPHGSLPCSQDLLLALIFSLFCFMPFQIIHQSWRPCVTYHFMLVFHDGAPLAPEFEDHAALSVSDCFNEFTVTLLVWRPTPSAGWVPIMALVTRDPLWMKRTHFRKTGPGIKWVQRIDGITRYKCHISEFLKVCCKLSLCLTN